ncbi:hypothetical protein GCM10023324_65000 [Streptomyces youssoufiensis]
MGRWARNDSGRSKAATRVGQEIAGPWRFGRGHPVQQGRRRVVLGPRRDGGQRVAVIDRT